MAQKIEWIILVTDYFEKSYTFYKDALELEVVREVREETFCQFKLQNCFLAIYGREEMEKLVGKEFVKTSGGAIYTFGETENIDHQYEKLQNKGVNFIKTPITQSWGQKTAYFTDPDGHIWELQQWVK